MNRSLLSRFRDRLSSFLGHEIWERELSDLGRLKGFLFYQLRVIFLVMRGFSKDRCGLRAAGLTYITLLTFIPFLAVVFSISTQFGGLREISQKHLKPTIYKFLTFESGIGTTPDSRPGKEEDGQPPEETSPGEGEEPEAPPYDGIAEPPDEGEEVPEPGLPSGEGEDLPDKTSDLGGVDAVDDADVEGRKQLISTEIDKFISRIQTGKIGGIAAIFMLLGTVGLLSHIERSFNDIWGVKRSRTFFQRITVYWWVITFGPILLGVSVALTASFENSSVVDWIETSVPFSKEVIETTIPLLFSWGGLILLYLFMPNTRVRPGAALWGGIFAGTLWEVSKRGYTLYFASTIKWESLFGALGVIPILLIWIYLTWVIILFGAELAFAHQNARTYRKEEASLAASPHFREVVALGIIARVGRHHTGGFVPPTGPDLAQEMGVPVRLVHDLLFLLTKYGLVMEASGSEKSPGYVPARPLDQIRAQEVADIVRHHAPMPLTLPVGEETAAVTHLVDDGDRAREAVFEAVTIAQLISGLGSTAGTPASPPPDEPQEESFEEDQGGGPDVDDGEGAAMDGWGEEESSEEEPPQDASGEEVPPADSPADEQSSEDPPVPGENTPNL